MYTRSNTDLEGEVYTWSVLGAREVGDRLYTWGNLEFVVDQVSLSGAHRPGAH